MNFSKPILYCEHKLLQYLLLIVLTLFVTLTVNGCSSSEEAGTTNDPPAIDPLADETTSLNSETVESDLTIDVPNASNTGSMADPTANASGGESAEPEAVASQPSTIVPEPPLPATVQVNFDITVPAYMSNELLIRLNWGGIDTTASWVRDESWFISENLPVNTENLLVVTFTDRNGELELGTYEQLLVTTSGTADSYLIQADQFDTDRWDTDGDGISNLNELLTGKDPLIDESLSLEIRDGLDRLGREAVLNLSTYSVIHEIYIPDERPYFEDTSVITPWELDGETFNDSTSSTIDIDADGNGSLAKTDFTQHSPAYFTSIKQEGTRTNTGNSIQWSSTHSRFNIELRCRIQRQFQSETRRLNDRSLTQVGFQEHRKCNGDSDEIYDITYTLTGESVVDSSLCEATSGAVTIVPNSVYPVSSWEYFKEPDDLYWTVNGLDDEGQLVEEFLAPIDITFYCNFSDL